MYAVLPFSRFCINQNRNLTFDVPYKDKYHILHNAPYRKLDMKISKFCIMQNIDIYIFEIHNENNSNDGKFPSSALSKI